MIWGCMAASGAGQLQFIDSTTDRWGYSNTLKNNLKQSAEKLSLIHFGSNKITIPRTQQTA